MTRFNVIIITVCRVYSRPTALLEWYCCQYKYYSYSIILLWYY